MRVEMSREEYLKSKGWVYTEYNKRASGPTWERRDSKVIYFTLEGALMAQTLLEKMESGDE